MSNERTEPKHKTFGPADGTGRDWHQYFEDNRAASRVVAPDPDDDDDLPEPITVTTPAHEVDESALKGNCPRALLTWRNRLLANDFLVKVGHSIAWHEETFYKNGNPNQPEHEEHQWWINALKDGQYITISYNVVDGAANSTRTVRKLNSEMRNYGDAELKELVEA
jgi:hypothetical protein